MPHQPNSLGNVIRGAGIPHTELGKKERIFRAISRELPAIEKYLPSSSSVLDWGCGSGEFAHVLRSRGYRVTGYEPVHGSAEDARKEYSIEVLEQIQPRAQWNAVTCMEVLQYVPNLNEEILNISRCILPDGYLFVSKVNSHSPWRLIISLPDDEVYDLEHEYATPGPEYLRLVDHHRGEDFVRTTDHGIRRLVKLAASWLDAIAESIGWHTSLFEIVVYQKKLLP
jgi:SAM-dependent methyltransferase